MSTFTTVLALIVMGLVVLVLIRGLFNMLKGTDPNKSNKLMQLRILLQAVAIVLIMLTLWITGGGRPT
ncbi:twin transmembrane helix small protein [Neorhizobium sp. BETTINA12A]|uniref:twin transmembrane helix small protein n=1 Tax=Neorhizobium sp. BETTINA12A TaxID=2908924 RepID=UPI001FF0F60B|nr:twin transmembrane helix small protein [Neorhizobium sp. BETTINA12A]MCJ9753252.1 twin transmembrane helix small protein [Neorhizobium sp. BETTINA12A]